MDAFCHDSPVPGTGHIKGIVEALALVPWAKGQPTNRRGGVRVQLGRVHAIINKSNLDGCFNTLPHLFYVDATISIGGEEQRSELLHTLDPVIPVPFLGRSGIGEHFVVLLRLPNL